MNKKVTSACGVRAGAAANNTAAKASKAKAAHSKKKCTRTPWNLLHSCFTAQAAPGCAMPFISRGHVQQILLRKLSRI
jgi:hypothetical protein